MANRLANGAAAQPGDIIKSQAGRDRIQQMYRRDVIIIYAFVVMLWLVLWSVFFFVANRYIEDNLLRVVLIVLGLSASVFNSVGMIQNTRRLKHEAERFYSQDIYWQEMKRAQG